VIKSLVAAVLAAGVGIGCGWMVHASRYSGNAEFGPYKLGDRTRQDPVESVRQTTSSQEMPKVEVVGGDEFDFGVMEPGGEGTHSFVVRNVGKGPLELRIAGSTCKCTVGSLKDAVLKPGEQTDIDLTWVAKSSSEEFGQSAILKTNDPTRGEVNLKIRGRIISSMTMVPRNFSFGDVESGEPIVLESTVFSFNKTPIVPVGQTFSNPIITQRSKFTVEEVSVQSTGSDEYASAVQAFKVRVDIEPGLPQGPLRENFSFNFAPQSTLDENGKHDEDTVFHFTAETTGRIVGAITLVESRRVYNGESGYIFTIGEVNPTEQTPYRANIMLRGPARESIKLSIGDVKPAGILRADLGEPIGRSSTVLVPLTLTVDPAAPPTDLMGRGTDDFGIVVIKTDDPNLSPLELKVRFSIPKK